MARPREHARLEKELLGLQQERDGKANEDEQEVFAEKWNGDISHWRGWIKGPLDTPYEGGVFYLDIVIPGDYPYNPPKISFLTKVWHPNVSSQTGAICLDILKHEWSPALSIRTALLSIQAMLADPVPADPQDAEVAKMLIENPDLFHKTAKHWTETFAMQSSESQEDKVKKLTDMGFDSETARTALKNHNWDETSALNSLLG
ncbi:ubiquitin-conjugating enzyme E2 27 [Cyclospora cayetanensis]|uniref:Ubiquitin-conjugating enzyme E2 27 n=1 Tax=Cyclospora cayetanensis TaxID=88456 RepID=A0A6P6RRY0_9EIME|nr:ubiquitin-conjugating enzyme E2 27 [Cyclospora cayetanensis]